MLNFAKTSVVGIISFLAVVGFSTPATVYANSDSFFFPSPNNSVYTQPQEQLIVYAFGPSSYPQSQPSYYGYQPGYSYNGNNYPAQQSYYTQPQMGGTPNYYGMQNSFPMNGDFTSKFLNYTYIAPQTSQYGGFGGGYGQSYGGGYTNYYPQNSYSSYGGGSYGGSYPYTYAEPTGSKDFWGNDLCNWGSDYQGYPCQRDPHQWIHDPYTGAWY